MTAMSAMTRDDGDLLMFRSLHLQARSAYTDSKQLPVGVQRRAVFSSGHL